MTAEQILPFAQQNITFPNGIVLTFKDNTQWVGFFNTNLLEYYNTKSNKWKFVKYIDRNTLLDVDGEDVIGIEYKTVPFE